MELMSGSQGRALDDSYWQRSLDEDYWVALLEQGEIVLPAAGAADDQGPVEPAAEPRLAGPVPAKGNMPDEGNVWLEAQAAMQQGDLFSLTVLGANRGGLLVEWNGLQGFVPASHLKAVLRNMDQNERMSELASRAGDSVTVRLIEVDPEQKRLVFWKRSPGRRRTPAHRSSAACTPARSAMALSAT